MSRLKFCPLHPVRIILDENFSWKNNFTASSEKLAFAQTKKVIRARARTQPPNRDKMVSPRNNLFCIVSVPVYEFVFFLCVTFWTVLNQLEVTSVHSFCTFFFQFFWWWWCKRGDIFICTWVHTINSVFPCGVCVSNGVTFSLQQVIQKNSSYGFRHTVRRKEWKKRVEPHRKGVHYLW